MCLVYTTSESIRKILIFITTASGREGFSKFFIIVSAVAKTTILWYENVHGELNTANFWIFITTASGRELFLTVCQHSFSSCTSSSKDDNFVIWKCTWWTLLVRVSANFWIFIKTGFGKELFLIVFQPGFFINVTATAKTTILWYENVGTWWTLHVRVSANFSNWSILQLLPVGNFFLMCAKPTWFFITVTAIAKTTILWYENENVGSWWTVTLLVRVSANFWIFIKTGFDRELFLVACQPTFFIYYGTVTPIAKTICKCTWWTIPSLRVSSSFWRLSRMAGPSFMNAHSWSVLLSRSRTCWRRASRSENGQRYFLNEIVKFLNTA